MAEKTLFDIIMARLDELGISANAASMAASGGKNRDLVRKLRGKNRLPNTENAEGLARVLGWGVADLIRAGETGVTPQGTTPPLPVRSFDAAIFPADVPVLGTAAGAADGSFVIDGAIDWVRRPPALINAKNLYALYVVGDSMSPRFIAGDLVFVSPDRPAAGGDAVVVQSRRYDGDLTRSWIKFFVRQTEDEIIVRQINPEAEIRHKAESIVSVHRVLSMRELFGA